MSEKHYVVSLHKGFNKDQIINDLNRDTSADASVDSNIIPDRTVENVNTRPTSKRIFEISLTDYEAKKLTNYSRVRGVELPLEWSSDWVDYEQDENWVRDSTSTARGNWGFLRQVNNTNLWGLNVTQDLTAGTTYDYHLDGTGVDYIHQEDYFRFTHEQWQDKNGVSRLEEFQWNTLPNMGSIPAIDYTASSPSSHATHCCGTAVGKDYGWAKNARIYCLPINIISQAYWFDAIKEFHKAKTLDPVTGFKRPTVVGASWGFKAYFTSVTDIQFRGSSVGSVKADQYGTVGDSNGKFNANLQSLNVEVEEMQDEGVHYIKSAGNQRQKLCYDGDIDYDNYITRSVASGGITAGNPVHYNRGAGNIGPETIVVGNLDSALNGTVEATENTSDKGPRVDLWAAGTNIMSAGSADDTDSYNNTGTSMATPQISGMSCLILQLNPGWTPAQLRKWWQDNAVTGLLFQGSTDENTPTTFFSDDQSLQNGPNRIAYFPFAANRALTSTAGIS